MRNPPTLTLLTVNQSSPVDLLTTVSAPVLTVSADARKPLNQRQQAFLIAYQTPGTPATGNATRAAIAAGYSPATAKQSGSRLLAEISARNNPRPESPLATIPPNANITVVVERDELADVRSELGVNTHAALQSIMRSALADPRKLFNQDGSPKPIHELDDDTAMAIESVEVVETYAGTGEDRTFTGYVKKYKFNPRSSAQQMLMRHLNLFRDDNKAKGEGIAEGSVAALLQAMQGRRSALPVVHQVDDAEVVDG